VKWLYGKAVENDSEESQFGVLDGIADAEEIDSEFRRACWDDFTSRDASAARTALMALAAFIQESSGDAELKQALDESLAGEPAKPVLHERLVRDVLATWYLHTGRLLHRDGFLDEQERSTSEAAALAALRTLGEGRAVIEDDMGEVEVEARIAKGFAVLENDIASENYIAREEHTSLVRRLVQNSEKVLDVLNTTTRLALAKNLEHAILLSRTLKLKMRGLHLLLNLIRPFHIEASSDLN
jgi:hypothetical protein